MDNNAPSHTTYDDDQLTEFLHLQSQTQNNRPNTKDDIIRRGRLAGQQSSPIPVRNESIIKKPCRVGEKITRITTTMDLRTEVTLLQRHMLPDKIVPPAMKNLLAVLSDEANNAYLAVLEDWILDDKFLENDIIMARNRIASVHQCVFPKEILQMELDLFQLNRMG